MDTIMGPFWRYYGGKWRAAPRYPAPSYGLIVEPFAGAAGYASRYHDRDVLLIDADPVIIGIWSWLIGATRDDVLSVPDVPEGGTVDDIDAPKGARDLVGFWCNGGVAQPRKTPSKWALMDGSHWGGWIRARGRVAADVSKIKHWKAVCGGFDSAPDVPATWFIDPPYQTAAGRHYKHSTVDYGALGLWTLDRLGQVIACDQGSADWLPWTGEMRLKSTLGESSEVVFLRDSMDLFSGGRH
jgi:hypothetical protein